MAARFYDLAGILFLALAIWGAIHPMYYFITWFQSEGWSLSAMIGAWHVNAATSGLVWDLTIAAIALLVISLLASWHYKTKVFLWVIPASFCIGVSCGAPLLGYFWVRMLK